MSRQRFDLYWNTMVKACFDALFPEVQRVAVLFGIRSC